MWVASGEQWGWRGEESGGSKGRTVGVARGGQWG